MTEAASTDGKPLLFGDPIPMYCAACGKPWRFDAASARPYVCPCGSTKATGTVTFRG